MNKQSNFKKGNIPLCHNKDLIEYLLILRYGLKSKRNFSKPILNISSISKLIKLSHTTVSYLLNKGKQKKGKSNQ